jgi:hypothetical protein
MERFFTDSEPKHRGVFGIAAVATVVIGAGLAGAAILHLRKPPAPAPVVIESPPEIRVVEKPAPPPQVIVKEVRVTVPAPAPPPPPVQLATANPVWDGVWRRRGNPLPMVRLKQLGQSVTGEIAPNWSAVLPFRDGCVVGDSVEFVADDGVFRKHFRMTLVGEDTAKLESLVTDDDWLTSLARANKAARTPQQALVLRLMLEHNAKEMRKPITVGTFTRSAG